MKVYFDGSCRPMPHGMATAVVARGRVWLQSDLGPGSAMEAEWLALLHAVMVAEELGLADPVLLGDALAVIAQANGAVRCPAPFAQYLTRLRQSPSVPRIRYLKRAQNLAGIALDRRRR